LGTPPEDDPGAGEGAPESIERSGFAGPRSTAKGGAEIDDAAGTSERASALAARIDAFIADGDAQEHKEASEPTKQRARSEIAALELDELEEVEDGEVLGEAPASGPIAKSRASSPPPRPVVAIPPPRPVAIPTPQRAGVKPPNIPLPRAATPNLATIDIPPVRSSAPVVVSIPSAVPTPRPGSGGAGSSGGDAAIELRARKRPTEPPPLPERARTPSTPPPGFDRPRTPSTPPGTRAPTAPPMTSEEMLSGAPDITKLDSRTGVEVGTAEAHVAVDLSLESQLEHPTVVDKAIAALGDAGGEARAEQLARELDGMVLSDPAAAAYVAYELGELYERRLADEARAVKAYGRAVNLDPSLRANLWAIRRVFYRRELWPNLAKLVEAEVQYARDDRERADLLLEKARVHAHRMNEPDEARAALDEATRIAPQHQGALLELERIVAKAGDTPALLDVWERLAEAVELPARKIAYWLEVGRAAGAARELGRAQDAFEKAGQLAQGTPVAERVARERLRVAEEHGSPEDIVAAIDTLATLLLAAFGPGGPAVDATSTPPGERLDRASLLRLELVALRRRQAQLVRASNAERAWELLQQASALAPGEPIVLADLTELAEELGRYDDLAELVQSWQAVEADPSRAMTLSIRRADALLRGGQRDQARALLASLEASAPGFAILTSIAERDALSRLDFAELARAYLAAAHAALLGTHLGPGTTAHPEPRAAAALYVQAAEVLAYEIGTPEASDEARAALGKAIEAVADYAPAIEAITELDDISGLPADALARLDAAIERAPAADKRPLIERAIRLARGHGDLERVIELQRDLWTLAPDDVAVGWRLEATFAQLGRDDERAELLADIARREGDATGRGTALFAAARVRERAGNVEAATELYRQVLELWPDDAFARESLVDLLRAQERWPELVAERRAEARTLPDGPAARRALREAAHVLEVRSADMSAAAAVYDEWLARMPEDRFALEGVARCRAALGELAGEVKV
jgi:cellulose synthase operon protein C